MKYRKLGASGVKVSELCLGAMTFGEADDKSFMHKVGSDEKTSFDILNRALELGVNFVDTADVYGQDGLSERIIGAWIERDQRRKEVVLATKFRFTMGEGANRSGASRYRIMRCVEHSLKRLRTDHIDLYQIHMQDLDTPEDEILRALDDLVTQGKVLYIGCSNYAAYRLMDSLWLSRTKNLSAFVTLQAQYSLVVRELEREHVPLCRAQGLGILLLVAARRRLSERQIRPAISRRRRGRASKSGRIAWPASTTSATGRSSPPSAPSPPRRAPRPPPCRWPGCSHNPKSPRASSARARWRSWKRT